MATATGNFTNSQAVTITLASLANGSSAVSSAIDNSTAKYLAANIRVKVRTNAAGTSATGIVEVYVVRSTDGGTDYADTTDELIGVIPANANGTTYARTFKTDQLGSHWKVGVVNRSGAALDSTGGNHEVEFTGVKIDIA